MSLITSPTSEYGADVTARVDDKGLKEMSLIDITSPTSEYGAGVTVRVDDKGLMSTIKGIRGDRDDSTREDRPHQAVVF